MAFRAFKRWLLTAAGVIKRQPVQVSSRDPYGFSRRTFGYAPARTPFPVERTTLEEVSRALDEERFDRMADGLLARHDTQTAIRRAQVR